MNYMEDIAHMLGLEIGEEFRLSEYPWKFKFGDDALYEWTSDRWTTATGEATFDLLSGKNELIKLPKPILDDIEKRYLKGVIRPFRDDVESICKCETYNGKKEYLTISFFSTVSDMYFPDYPIGTMYKGMVLNRKYSIEELDL